MKNQYNAIKEKLEQGYPVLAKSTGGRFCNEDYEATIHWQRRQAYH